MIKKMGKINIVLLFVLASIWSVVLLLNISSSVKIQNYTNVGDSQYLGKKLNIRNNDISIDFSFYVNKLKNEPKKIKYENIFQTANYNDGIRIEFARLAGNESKWALVYTDKNKKLKGIGLGALPQKEKWHDVKIRYIAKNDQLLIYLNEDIIKSVNNCNIKLNLDNIVTGHGFTKDRSFDGMVYNFRLTNSPVKDKYYKRLYIVTFFLLLLMIRKYLISLNNYVIDISKKYISKDNLHKYFIFIVVLLFTLFYAVKYSNQTTLEDYTNINNPIKLDKPLSINNSMSIEFDFYIDPLKNKVEGIQYENLFQTADWNSGFRVEFARKTESATLWGLAYTNNNGQLKIIQLGTAPSESKWHTMKVSYLKDKNRIDVFVDGIDIRSYNNANTTLNFDNVISGKAFEDRKFHGKIKNFTIQKSFMPLYLYIVLSIVSILVFVFLIIKGLKEHHIDTNTFSKITIFKKSFLIISLLSFFSIFIFSAESYLVGENDIFRAIVALFSIVSFIVLIIFFHNVQNTIIRKSILATLYIAFYSYISLYFTSAMYMIGKFSDQVRRPYGLSIDEIAAIYQSSVSESIQFIITSLGYMHLIIIFIVPLILTFILYFSMRYIHPIKNHKITLSYAFVVIASFYIILPSIPTFPKVIYAGFSKYSQQVEEMKKIALLRKGVDFDLSLKNDMKGTHVLVIGESANKEHMGAYGYFRKTTPWLTKQKINDNFIFFQNTYAPYCHAVPALLKTITAANQYNQKRQKQAVSIIDIAKKAGFKTHWISEQHGAMIDTPLSVIINESDEVKYVEEGGHLIDALNKTMENIDKSKNNLIILHLMGSHADYRQRIVGYKDGFTDTKREEIGNYSQDKHKKFMNNLLNPYDSSIKYTDKILKNIFEITAEKHSFVDSFIYFSDHGEDVFDKKFHNSANFSWPMVHIPLVMYFSDRYKQKYKDDISLLNSRANNIFTNDLLYNTMLDIFKVESEKFEDGYSLLDANYTINETNALTMQKSPDEDTTYYTMTNKRYIKDDPVYIAKNNIEHVNKYYPNMVLANHCDIESKVAEASSLGFVGYEFNIDLEEFKIGHPPEYILNKSIDSFLDFSDKSRNKKLWFDIKSKKGKNINYSLKDFEILNKKFNIKNRSIIESFEKGLNDFTEEGWKTSYYIHPTVFPKCQYDEICAKKMAKEIINSGATATSFGYSNYHFIKTYVEPLIPKNINYHIFGLPKEFQIYNVNCKATFDKSDIANDQRVETLLLESSRKFRIDFYIK